MNLDRRRFLRKFGKGLGGIALADLLGTDAIAAAVRSGAAPLAPPDVTPGVIPGGHFAAKAKRIIYLFQAGGPSQLDLFDRKPLLIERHGTQLPDEVRAGQRLTGMSAHQSSMPLVGSPFKFRQHGESGAWLSELLPHTAQIADELCVIRSMHTEAINHGPAVTFLQTGSQFPGRPSMGAWLDYGLGSENPNLPAFVVMVTQGTGGQPLYDRLWGSGFLPTQYQGVKFRSVGDPVLFLKDPKGFRREDRRVFLDALAEESRSRKWLARVLISFLRNTFSRESACSPSRPEKSLLGWAWMPRS